MKWLPRTLVARIGGALLLASILPTLVVGTIAFSEVRSNLSEAARASNLALITSIAQDLNTILQESRRTLDVAASLPVSRAPGPGRRELLQVIAKREPLLREVYILDPDGAVVDAAGYHEPGLRDRHPASYGGYVTDAYFTGQTPVVTVIVELRDEHLSTVGYICGDIDLAVVSDIIGQTALPENADLFIVDASRRVIAKTPSARPALATPAIEKVHSTLAPGTLTYVDPEGGRWLSVYRNLGAYDEFRGLRWGIILQQETRYAFARAHRTAATIAILTLFFMIGSVIAGRLMARRLAAPLRRLAGQADRVAEGKEPKPVRSRNMPEEVAHLAHRFSEMASRVNRSRAALTRRSEELEEVNRRLETLHELYSRLVRAIPVGVASVDGDGCLVTVNPTFVQMAGARSAEALQGRSLTTPVDGDGAGARLAEALREVLGGEALTDVTLDRTALPISGAPVERLRLRVAPLGSDRSRGAVILLEDLSEQARVEAFLVRSEKLSSVGVLAAGVAHEINNPLTAILGYSRLLLEDIPEGDPHHGPMSILADEARRVQDIVRNLLDFSSPASSQTAAVDLNAAVEKILTVMAPQMRKARVRVETHLGDSLPPVLGDERRLQQVFVNLAQNAQQAMEEGGTLVIETGTTGDQVWVSFTDEGPGIPEDVLPRIFDPFFSTKAPGGGTGLGLSVSYSIVEEHDGDLEVDSTPGEGAVFRVSLPAVSGADEHSGARGPV